MGAILHPVRTLTHPVAELKRAVNHTLHPVRTATTAAKDFWNSSLKASVAIGHAIGLGGVSDKAAKSLYGYDPKGDATKRAVLTAANDANSAVAGDRLRRRIGSALATGAGDSGTADTTSAIAYGKSTLGG